MKIYHQIVLPNLHGYFWSQKHDINNKSVIEFYYANMKKYTYTLFCNWEWLSVLSLHSCMCIILLLDLKFGHA